MGDSIINLLEQMYATQVPNASTQAATIAGYMQTVCGIGALLYIFGNIVNQIATNQEINFIPFLRPFVIIMLISFSGTFSNAIDGVGNTIRGLFNKNNNNISAHVKVINEKMEKLIKEKWDLIKSDPVAYEAYFGRTLEQDEAGTFGAFGNKISVRIAQASDEIENQIYKIIQNILLVLMYLAEAILLLFSIMYRLVLRMGFPIAITLTLFPGFTQNLANWFGKYVNFALLPAIAAMYSNICFKFLETYLDSYNPQEVLAQMGAETAQPGYLGLAFIGIMIMCLIGYTQIPSMTSMLVTVGGVGNIAQNAVRSGRNMAGTSIAAGKTTGSVAVAGAEKLGHIGQRLGAAFSNTFNETKGARATMSAGILRVFKPNSK
jgi:energy-coupling factor transporter transmembrane protein EcfT